MQAGGARDLNKNCRESVPFLSRLISVLGTSVTDPPLEDPMRVAYNN